MATLFNVLTAFQGKANYRNFSRYCAMSENVFVDGIGEPLILRTSMRDCLIRRFHKIHAQTNAALSALNLLKFEDKINKKSLF